MSSPVIPGTVMDRYRIEGVIGAGSMGDVFRAVDIDLGRKVAVKILSDRHRDNEELRARFVREARAVASISHPNVVQVFTTGTFDGRPYIAMELLDGMDLGSSVEQEGRWSSVDAARAIRDAARGLEAAAKAGLIHRDVKPSNLVLLKDGSVKVTDFGLAKPVNPGSEPALTALGVVVGTPDYIAPEQARGDTIDERVDIYALGGTLYYLLAGRPPFRTGNPAEDKYLKVVARHLKNPPPNALDANPAADHELANLALAMMAKRPVDRPGYDELIEQLIGIIERIEAASGPIPLLIPRSEGSSGLIAPTPFVGTRGGVKSDQVARAATDLADPDELRRRSGGRGATGGDDAEDDDAAPTHLRLPTRPPLAQEPAFVGGGSAGSSAGSSSMPVVAAPRVSRWLVALTVLSALVFLVGLGLLLFGPMPEGTSDGAADEVTAPAESGGDGT